MKIDGPLLAPTSAVRGESPGERLPSERSSAEETRGPDAGKASLDPPVPEPAPEVSPTGTPLRLLPRYFVDRERHEIVIRLVDPEDGRVVREIPPEELRSLAHRMSELAGELLDRYA